MESFPLFVIALALSAGALVLGIGAERLRARGVRPHAALAIVAMLSIAVQLALILRLPIPSKICWAVVAAAGAASVLSYASLAEYFPKQVIGRANGALGFVDIGGAFVLQYATGLIIQQWPAPGRHYPVTAYQTAFTIDVVLQLLALGWFVLPSVRERVSAFVSDLLGRAVFRFDNHPRPSSLYDRAAQV